MAEFCTTFEIKRGTGRKTPIFFYTTLYLTCTIPQNPFKFLPKILTQIVQIPELLGGAKYCRKLPVSTQGATTLQMTDRQTVDRQTDRRHFISRT